MTPCSRLTLRSRLTPHSHLGPRTNKCYQQAIEIASLRDLGLCGQPIRRYSYYFGTEKVKSAAGSERPHGQQRQCLEGAGLMLLSGQRFLD